MGYSSIQSVSFKQDIASSVWTINHGCGYFPVIDVCVYVNGTLQKIMPQDIKNVDVNTTQVLFSKAYTGIARLC